jgi:Protein of unknown function (DUF3224)
MTYYRAALGILAATGFVVAVAATIVFAQSASAPQTAAQAAANPAPIQKGRSMSIHAAGPFDVKLTPQDDKLDPTLGRMTIDKQFHGDLEATSKGQMLTAMSDVKGSAGYVAVERVTGTLRTPGGTRSGSFALLHRGIMTRGAPELSVTVVPDSGTGQLTGLTGTMTINIVEGKHSYDFEYILPE